MKHLLKNIIIIVVGTIVAYYLFKYVAPLVAPFIVAVFLAFFIEPLVERLQNKTRIPRPAAVGLTMLVVFGTIGLVMALAVTRLIIELVHLSAYLPYYISNIKSTAMSVQNKALAYYFALPQDVIEFVNNKLSGTTGGMGSLVGKIQLIVTKLLNFMLQLASSVPAWIILIIISAIATYFIAKDRRIIVNFWMSALPKPWGRKSLEITREVFQAIISYVRAQLLLISMTFLQSMIGLYLIGAPYALIMGIVIGVADLIPILGPSSIYIPWIIWEFATGDSTFAIKLLILYGVVIVVRQILETKIVSSSMGLHPLATLMAMYVGLKLLGPLGVIVGPLFIITVKAFASAGIIGWKAEDKS